MLSARIRRVHFSWGYCSVLAGCNGSSQAGSVVISRNGVLMMSETQAHPYQGWTTFVVLQALSCKVPVVQSIFCLNNPFGGILYFSFKLKANESDSLNIALPSGKKSNVLQFGSIKNPKGFCFISFLSTQNSSFCIFGVPMCLIFVELLWSFC